MYFFKHFFQSRQRYNATSLRGVHKMQRSTPISSLYKIQNISSVVDGHEIFLSIEYV